MLKVVWFGGAMLGLEDRPLVISKSHGIQCLRVAHKLVHITLACYL